MTIRCILNEIYKKYSNLHIKKYQHYTVQDLLNNITQIDDERFLVMAEWDVANTIPNAGDADVDVSGYIVFYYIEHDDYFYLEKMGNEDEVKKFLLDFSENYFFHDIIVFLDGNIADYEINKNEGKVYFNYMSPHKGHSIPLPYPS